MATNYCAPATRRLVPSAGVAHNDQPYQFVHTSTSDCRYPFYCTEFARLLIVRGRVRAANEPVYALQGKCWPKHLLLAADTLTDRWAIRKRVVFVFDFRVKSLESRTASSHAVRCGCSDTMKPDAGKGSPKRRVE